MLTVTEKKLTDSRKRAKILADNCKSHHPIETLFRDGPLENLWGRGREVLKKYSRKGKLIQKNIHAIAQKKIIQGI